MSSFLASSLSVFSGIISILDNFWLLGFKTSKASACFFSFSTIVFVCFSKAFPNKEYANLACSITCLWLEGNISSSVTYS